MGKNDYLRRPDAHFYLKVRDALQRWDPIGVFEVDSSWPRDEYDGYVPEVLRALQAGVSAAELTEVMIGFASDRMEVTPDLDATRAIAEELVSYFAAT